MFLYSIFIKIVDVFKTVNILSVFIVFIFMSITVFSQEKSAVDNGCTASYGLDEVVVTATRTERQLSSLPMPVTLISKKQLQKSGAIRLKDILEEQTGITLVSDFGGSQGVQLQGVSADYTLILIDGVPIIGRASGNIDLKRLSVNNIQQIEIVKGPSSSLYGSEAIGGVINIITSQPKREKLEGFVRYLAKGGATNELDINTNIKWKRRGFGVVSGINLNTSKGFDLSPETASKTTEGHQNFTGNLQLNYDFSDKLKTIVSSRYYTQSQDIPFSRIVNKNHQNNKNDEKTKKSENKRTDWNINTKIIHKINDSWSFDYQLYTTKYTTETIFNGENKWYRQTLVRPEIKSTNTFRKGTLILGAGANFDALKRTEFEDVKKYNTPYFFSQFDFNPIDKLNIIVGARFENSNQYESAFTPKISSSYKINDWITAKASVGYGFKAPDFRQLYFNFKNSANGYIVLGTHTLHDIHGDLPSVKPIKKELKTERSIGYNFGFQLKLASNLKLNINLFRNDIKDMIESFDTQLSASNLGLPLGTRLFSYRNINEVYTQGVELDLVYKMTQNFSFLAGYQFLNSADKTAKQQIKDGQIFFRRTPFSISEKMKISDYYGLADRSKHMANCKLFYENYQHHFSASIRAVYRGKYAPFDSNNSQGIIDDFDNFVASNTNVNVTMSKTFFNLMHAQIGINNLFNEKGIANKEKFANNDTVLRLGTTYYASLQFNF
ncbi:TonB-dependent receptor [Tenacibaculum piscium]|uniref:Outer membrane receptor protein n=1 Tax=Tenacibaculum piscium TaxID=1458515 RepID=A0A2H1YHR4_9FLAO|nr:TonB-dependent receptor [Tenacibaculum piscium]MBE7671539.1 TonB-dependent receptor [Tenacibaculum piscium]SOS74337.1 Outer membrane receptor protein [Tenacibaculum piscium]